MLHRQPRPRTRPRLRTCPRPRTATLATVLAVALALTAPSLGSAARAADPAPPPTAGAVRAAQDTAALRGDQAAAAQRQLTAAQNAERDLDIAAEQAVERYNGAQVRMQQAEAASARAGALATLASARQAVAREAAAALAAQQYRMGGMSPALNAVQGLLQMQNLADATIEQQALRAAAGQARSIVDQATSTADASAAASADAARTATAARQAADTVRQAAADARAQLAAQHAEVAVLTVRRTTLLAQLAAAQQISVALAEQRQQALAAAAAAAAAKAAADAAREAAAAAAAATQAAPPAPGRTASAAVAFARAQLGLPYVWGGAGPDNFDCSGLTMRAWERAGVQLPHFAADQYARSTPVGYGQLRPGDLVFWSHDGTPADIYHVALYLGDDRMIEAPRTGDVVKVANLWIMGTPNYYARP